MWNKKEVPEIDPIKSVEAKISVSSIRRIPVPVITASDEMKSLATDALELFGYGTLTGKIMTPLGNKLRELDIDVLDKDTVDKYMKSMTKDTKMEWGWAPLDEFSNKAYGGGRSLYTKPIPQFVLHKAIQIKKAVPEATFFIRELGDNPDPFLWVGIKNFDSYFIEVWDEPKFEGRQIIS